MPKPQHVYEVVVGNIGTTYAGTSRNAAFADFRDYRDQSKRGIGRAAGETVTVLRDNIIIREHFGNQEHD